MSGRLYSLNAHRDANRASAAIGRIFAGDPAAVHPVHSDTRRTVIVHITCLAPGHAQASVEDPAAFTRWPDVDPVEGVRLALDLLQMRPADLTVSTLESGYPALMGRAHGFTAVPLAIFTQGLSEPLVRTILSLLEMSCWRPRGIR